MCIDLEGRVWGSVRFLTTWTPQWGPRGSQDADAALAAAEVQSCSIWQDINKCVFGEVGGTVDQSGTKAHFDWLFSTCFILKTKLWSVHRWKKQHNSKALLTLQSCTVSLACTDKKKTREWTPKLIAGVGPVQDLATAGSSLEEDLMRVAIHFFPVHLLLFLSLIYD